MPLCLSNCVRSAFSVSPEQEDHCRNDRWDPYWAEAKENHLIDASLLDDLEKILGRIPSLQSSFARVAVFGVLDVLGRTSQRAPAFRIQLNLDSGLAYLGVGPIPGPVALLAADDERGFAHRK